MDVFFNWSNDLLQIVALVRHQALFETIIDYSTAWELEQGKTFSKWILIGKAEDVRAKLFFGSIISESQ